jgi:NADPH2 dehydrogenase/N-ethylmaleimide reductase
MLNDASVAYIHVADTNAWAGAPDLHKILPIIKAHFRGTIIVNASFTKAEALVDSGDADAVAVEQLLKRTIRQTE